MNDPNTQPQWILKVPPRLYNTLRELNELSASSYFLNKKGENENPLYLAWTAPGVSVNLNDDIGDGYTVKSAMDKLLDENYLQQASQEEIQQLETRLYKYTEGVKNKSKMFGKTMTKAGMLAFGISAAITVISTFTSLGPLSFLTTAVTLGPVTLPFILILGFVLGLFSQMRTAFNFAKMGQTTENDKERILKNRDLIETRSKDYGIASGQAQKKAAVNEYLSTTKNFQPSIPQQNTQTPAQQNIIPAKPFVQERQQSMIQPKTTTQENKPVQQKFKPFAMNTGGQQVQNPAFNTNSIRNNTAINA